MRVRAQSNVIAFIGHLSRSVSLGSMQSGETGSLAQVNRRSRERKGLEAIFSSQEAGSEREILTGAAGVLAGLVLSTLRCFQRTTYGPSGNRQTPSTLVLLLEHLGSCY